jgi:hypothetical protein
VIANGIAKRLKDSDLLRDLSSERADTSTFPSFVSDERAVGAKLTKRCYAHLRQNTSKGIAQCCLALPKSAKQKKQ